MNGNEIVAAIENLHAAYPLEVVEIWVGYSKAGKETYTARVGEACDDDDPLRMKSARADYPTVAAAKLIALAGKRDVEAETDAKIAKLRAELARLEQQQQPVLMES